MFSRALTTLVFLLALVLAPRPARALDVIAVYRAACERKIGVILRVEKRHIHLLSHDGTIEKIPRHEIVSLVYYPAAQFPLIKLPSTAKVKPVRIRSRDKRRWVELAFGWPINFSERKMSLLLPSGEDFTVDRRSVWSLEYDDFSATQRQRRRATSPLPYFEHPKTSGFCEGARRRDQNRTPPPSVARVVARPASQPASGSSSALVDEPGRAAPASSSPSSLPSPLPSPSSSSPRRPPTRGIDERRQVFPQQILNDRVVIRRELDRLKKGYEALVEDLEDQKFYPVPQIYRNRTSLGFWGSVFSRYAASESRSNNLTPLLTNTYSSGPFRYQHIFFTGTTPNGLLIHNEAQTQIFYRFKAAYFHASLFIDPNLALVGEKYFWRAEDLKDETLDDRVNEYAIVELGFDLGPVAFQIQPVSMASAAVKYGQVFSATQAVPLWRVGMRLVFAEWSVEAMGGYAPETQSDYDSGSDYGQAGWTYAYGRLNLGWQTPWHHITLRSWTVVRHLEHVLTRYGGGPTQTYRSLSVSSALQATLLFWHRFEVGAHLVLEVQKRQVDEQEAQVRALPKLSLFGSMSF